jgi:hypothetical protein
VYTAKTVTYPQFKRSRHLAAALFPKCFFGLFVGLQHNRNLAAIFRKGKPLPWMTVLAR